MLQKKKEVLYLLIIKTEKLQFMVVGPNVFVVLHFRNDALLYMMVSPFELFNMSPKNDLRLSSTLTCTGVF